MKKLPKILLAILAAIWAFVVVIMFVPDSWIPEEKEEKQTVETPKTPETPATEKTALPKNTVKVAYEKTSKYGTLEKKYKDMKLLEDIFASLWEFISLPKELTAEYSECGEENAFYDPETKKITVCYEIIEWVEAISKDKENPKEVANNILTFFILHEIGHALVDLYELPVTGREEDVADQLATFFLLGSNDAWALDTADSFYSDLSGLEASELPFEDEHSLDNQRYYNILCWVYGSDTESYDYLVKDEFIPEERAQQCEGEYVAMNNSFLTLLDKHIHK